MTTVRTTQELAALLKLSERRTLELMEDSEALGLAECVDGRWRLSQTAERELGWALRQLHVEIDDDSEPAARKHVGEAA